LLTGERVERRLAAVLAADVAGYSRLMGRDEERTLAGLKTVRKALVDPIIAAHRGRIVKTTGDGMLVEFASAVDAARGAVEIQRGMAGRNADIPQDARIEFRIGIHVGDIIIDDNDIFGDGVNIAARLEGIAEPGGVCISDDAQRQIRGKVDIVFDDMGPQTLKNIAEPMRAWRMQVNGGVPSAAPAKPSTDSTQPLALPDKPSIAVLPFQNMSGDPEQEYFADGMVEDIITALSRVKSFFVIARNSSFTYKGKAVDIKQVGSELGVRYILEGSVRKAGGHVRITGQLIEAVTGHHVWADRFDGELADVFDLQDRVGAAIGREFSHTLLAAVVRKPEADLTSALDSLIAAGLLFRQGVPPHTSYLFKHALVQDAAYGTLLRGPRRALHARIAEVLETQFAEIAENQPELLARHCTEAGLIEKAAGLWGRAGLRSLERSALVEAVQQLSRALEQISSLPVTPALRQEQVRLQVALINPLSHIRGFSAPDTKAAVEQARLLIEQAEALGEPPEDPLQLLSVLYGSFVANHAAANGQAMLDLAEQILMLAEKQGTTAPLYHWTPRYGRGIALYRRYRQWPRSPRSRNSALRSGAASVAVDTIWPGYECGLVLPPVVGPVVPRLS
jgi:TolB-like protein/class 3 adenylate cyclase